jgi:hypothetical protein
VEQHAKREDERRRAADDADAHAAADAEEARLVHAAVAKGRN